MTESAVGHISETWRSSPRVLELHKGKRRSSSSVFEIDITNGSIFIKQVFDVL